MTTEQKIANCVELNQEDNMYPPLQFNSPEAEAYQRGREDGVRMVISWIKIDTQEQELAQELKQLFPQYYVEIR